MTIEKRITNGGVVGFRAKVRLKGTPEVSETFDRLTSHHLFKNHQQLPVVLIVPNCNSSATRLQTYLGALVKMLLLR